jgi:hypothetical protein
MVTMIKSRRVRWVADVMHMQPWSENLMGRDHFEDSVDRRIKLKWISKNQSMDGIHLAQDGVHCGLL